MRGAFIILLALASTPAAAEVPLPKLLAVAEIARGIAPQVIDLDVLRDVPSPSEYQLMAGTPQTPIALEINALASHRSFEALTGRQMGPRSLSVTASNSILGVGTKVTYDVPLARGWGITPFVSLDYNRMDSGRTVNMHSPRPFVRDNADTGLTGSAGATLSHSFGAKSNIRIDGFGALIAATGSSERRGEFATLGARVLGALHSDGIESMWAEFGIRARFTLARRWQVQGAVLHTEGAVNGSTSAEMISLHHRF
jgi:Autotransporter beta-domain